jgi:phosphomevalonate kinase
MHPPGVLLCEMWLSLALVIATAPGKLILTGEYAVLDGAPALVTAVDRRAVATRDNVRGSSPFLLAVAQEIANRRGIADPAAQAALEIAVDSSAFYDGHGTKLGLGSSAAVTVAATACALSANGPIDRAEVLAIASAAHGNAQGLRGTRGSGADIAAAVHGGTIAFTIEGTCKKLPWPASVALVPFFTGAAADTVTLVAQIAAAREARRTEVDAALIAIGDASRAACGALSAPRELAGAALVAALSLAAIGIDRLAVVTGVDLVPTCVTTARSALTRLGGTAKTTGAGGGDVGVAVVPVATDVTEVGRILIESGCRLLRISVDETGVDTRPRAQ